jgi:hypothetical protein
MKYDFSGYATKNGLKCSDGRTILKDAFKDNDGQTVPLVWQHLHNDPSNILGHAKLENREDGVYAYCTLNDSDSGRNAKQLIEHKDITALSIFANGLKQKGKDVIHGAIREVSLVLSGANPGAFIDFISFAHADGETEVSDEEAIIYTGLELSHAAGETSDGTPASKKEESRTVQDVIDSMNPEQKNVMYALVAHAMEITDDNTEEEDNTASQSDDEGETFMKHNVFDKTETNNDANKPTLTHDQLRAIVTDAQRCGSFREAFLAHAVTYGIENIDYLFPDAKAVSESPDLVARRMEWVAKVIDGAKHTPFSRIKSMSADLTLDTARAKGYVKGSLKKEEFFALSKRVTTPTTFYKKQKLDRDDIIDITDLDVVAWLKAEMRMLLDEELARAILVSDGREGDDEDKINESNIRPISKDDPFYAHRVQVAANTEASTLVEEILRQRTNYKGSGTPTLFTTDAILVDMLLIKDKMGRRIYNTKADLAASLLVDDIVPVEVMQGVTSDQGDLIAILVNMKDYTLGADKGGQVSMFDDFDIDYNQYKYLIEGRCSGALTKPKSALVFWRATGTLVPTVTAPTFVAETNTITIPGTTGIVYMIDGEVVSAGDVVITEDTVVEADPATGYYFAPNAVDNWEFEYTEGD